ncbi:uncharacterized protein LOC110665012 isoform X2 [Hevea brasiliensis]|uniref:uncharacterized protein LOC110665012 isoform X2 n=1 Tax=Hevea brasiliensis TaxID=3981 RepID=UPI000B78CD9B|nr:uncharacterized protein LOC110665012 isoform X2 [Hevea brasiliensis]
MGKCVIMMMAAAMVVVLWAAVSVDVGWCKDAVNMAASNVEVKAKEMKQKAAMQGVKEKADSWSDWAYGKFSGGLGLKGNDAREAAQNLMDRASRTSDTVKRAASEASRRASEKKGKADQVIRMASDRASDAREAMAGAMNYGKDKNDAYDMASNWVSDSKDAMAEGMHYGRSRLGKAYEEAMKHGKERAAHVHDEAKQQFNKAKGAMESGMGYRRWDEMDVFEEAINKVGEACMTAKETMNFQGKSKYEAAKERMSKATGDLGAKMRNERATDMYDEAKNAKRAMQGAMGHEIWEEMGAFVEAVNNVGTAYRSAKEDTTFQGQSKYEAAKERMSKDTADH